MYQILKIHPDEQTNLDQIMTNFEKRFEVAKVLGITMSSTFVYHILYEISIRYVKERAVPHWYCSGCKKQLGVRQNDGKPPSHTCKNKDVNWSQFCLGCGFRIDGHLDYPKCASCCMGG